MNLNNVNYIEIFRKLDYPKHEMLIVGSGVLALFGFRGNSDLDIWVTENIFKKLSEDSQFILTKSKLDGSDMYKTICGNIEISVTLPPFKDTVKDHLKRAIITYGLYFQSLPDILKWKKMVNRDKDKFDIVVIEKYLENELAKKYFKKSKGNVYL